MSPDIFFGAGDTAPIIEDTLIDPSGIPLDLAGAAVVVRYRDKDQIGVEITETVTIVQTTDPDTQGDVEWTPAAPAAAGDYNLNWVATLASGKVVTCPNDRYLWMQVLAAP
jgi:hypothetical protein